MYYKVTYKYFYNLHINNLWFKLQSLEVLAISKAIQLIIVMPDYTFNKVN